MDSQELQKRYHARADVQRHLNRISNPFLRPKEIQLARRILALMPVQGGRLLEIGCGEGSNFFYLQAQRPDVRLVGVDFAVEKVVSITRGPGIQVVCADATQLPFSPQLFDVVLLRDLLHHINWARTEVLAEAWRLLRPGGALVVLEANPHTLLNRLFRFLQPVERGMADSTPQKLRALGEKFGAVDFDYLEASFLIRSMAYFLGWPENPRRWFILPLYSLARLWEGLMERLTPAPTWNYMLMTVRQA